MRVFIRSGLGAAHGSSFHTAVPFSDDSLPYALIKKELSLLSGSYSFDHHFLLNPKTFVTVKVITTGSHLGRKHG